MAHVLILGQTECGKTTLAKHLAHRCIRSDRPVLLYDPIGDTDFPCDWRTDDCDELVRVSEQNRNCCLVIDEAGSAVDRFAQDSRYRLATRSRHYGHFAIFITQRMTQISPLVRDQTSILYLFRCGIGVAKQMGEEFASPALANKAIELMPYECLFVDRFGRQELRKVKPYGLQSEVTESEPTSSAGRRGGHRVGLHVDGERENGRIQIEEEKEEP